MNSLQQKILMNSAQSDKIELKKKKKKKSENVKLKENPVTLCKVLHKAAAGRYDQMSVSRYIML